MFGILGWLGEGVSLLGRWPKGPDGKKNIAFKLIKLFSYVPATSNFCVCSFYIFAALTKSLNYSRCIIYLRTFCILDLITPCGGTTFWVFPFELKRNG